MLFQCTGHTVDVIDPLSIAVRLDMPSSVTRAGMRKGAGRGAGTGMEAPRGGQGHIITKAPSTPREMQCDVVWVHRQPGCLQGWGGRR